MDPLLVGGNRGRIFVFFSYLKSVDFITKAKHISNIVIIGCSH